MAANWLKWVDLVKVLAPIILGLVSPKLAPIAGTISDGIAEAEAIPSASGPDKLKYVLGVANDAASAVNSSAGKSIVDVAGLDAVVTSAVNTTVGVMNLVHPAAVAAATK